jgi:hypothetical protein
VGKVIFARLKLWAAAFGLVIAALAASWFGGRKSGVANTKAKHAAQDAKAYRDAIERMHDEDAIMGDDPAILRGQLRDRKPETR